MVAGGLLLTSSTTLLIPRTSRVVMSAASSPNDAGDQTGAINQLTHLHFVLDQKRKAFKNWNRLVYKLTKYSLIVLIVWGVFLI